MVFPGLQEKSTVILSFVVVTRLTCVINQLILGPWSIWYGEAVAVQGEWGGRVEKAAELRVVHLWSIAEKEGRQGHLANQTDGKKMQAATGTGDALKSNDNTDLMHHSEQFELMAPGSGRSCAASEISSTWTLRRS